MFSVGRQKSKPSYVSTTIGDECSMKTKKALFLTIWIHSLLIWLYVVARIVVNHVRIGSLFIDAIPFLTFTSRGIITFVLSMIFMFLYLTNGLEKAHASGSEDENWKANCAAEARIKVWRLKWFIKFEIYSIMAEFAAAICEGAVYIGDYEQNVLQRIAGLSNRV